MIGNQPDNFDQAARTLLGYGEEVRGYVRYEVTREYLQPYLGKTALLVLDVQGGSGSDATWLANLEHHVTMVEKSPVQREIAEKRKANMPVVLSKNLQIPAGDLEDLDVRHHSFDLVLCHGVAMYQDDPEAYIRRIARFVKPGGLLSVLEKGYLGSLKRLASSEPVDLKALKTLRTKQTLTNNVGFEVHAFRPAQLLDTVMDIGLEVEQWAGVRIFSDGDKRKIRDVPPSELQRIVWNEYCEGLSPRRAQGQMLHVIARRPNLRGNRPTGASRA